MIQDAMLMAVILNPFAQMVYLSDLMNRTSLWEFRRIYMRATLLTLSILLMVAFVGQFILFNVFQVSLPAMRVFGGLINLNLAYAYVMQGPEGIKLFHGDVTQLAQQIALPVMVGAGTVWVTMKISNSQPPVDTILIITGVLAVNGLMTLGYQRLIKKARGRVELAIVKYFGMLMRLNAMLIGAVGVQMILGGIRECLLLP